MPSTNSTPTESTQTSPPRPRLIGRFERHGRLAIYVRGRHQHLGDVALRRGVVDLPWRAIGPDDRLIGLFHSLREAAGALVEAVS